MAHRTAQSIGPGEAYPPAGERAAELLYLHDAFGTLFALERVHVPRWDDALREPPRADRADVRLVLIAAGRAPASLPAWLAVCREDAPEASEDALPALAQRLWLRSPHHRSPGPPPEAYLRAGFHALCPPHPPCDFGPRARAGIAAFARGRDGLTALAEDGRDAFDRRLRVAWATPEAFARTILLARLDDAGACSAAALVRRVCDTEIDADGAPAALEHERVPLLERLDPRDYFVRPREFAAALIDAAAWWDGYVEAYRAHYAHVIDDARAALEAWSDAESMAGLLRVLNRRDRRGAPIGDAAACRLASALASMRAWPETPLDVPAPGIVLGRTPPAFAEARSAAAAVLAAIDVQRRRTPA